MGFSRREVTEMLGVKCFHCVNIDDYHNLDSILRLTCNHNHQFEATLREVRNENFKCPYCEGNQVKKLDGIPPKKGYRVIGIDNATENVGVSIFEDGKLLDYGKITFSGQLLDRIVKNRERMKKIFENWEPDLVMLEDIQYQNNNVQVFKALAMLLGSTYTCVREYGAKCEAVLSKVWRSHFVMGSSTRSLEKEKAIKKVKQMFDISVGDDVAEAILIGKYGCDCIAKTAPTKLF